MTVRGAVGPSTFPPRRAPAFPLPREAEKHGSPLSPPRRRETPHTLWAGNTCRAALTPTPQG
ncbi:hypothetical protein GCM10027091_62390 [Streptomyces daliensis]